MASRVNLKFVFILGGAMALLATAVVWIGLKNYMPGGEQNIERGKKEEAAGNMQKAIMYYGRAVNKDRGNLEWVQTWLAAIEKYTPPDRQSYEDMYRGEYTAAIRAQADADRRNTGYFRRYLEERYQIYMRQGTSLRTWEGFEREFDDIIALYQGDDAGRKALRRYHGLAVAGQFGSNPEMASTKVEAALKELEAALEVDPADRDAVLAISSIKRGQADKAFRAGRESEGEELLAKAKTALEEFLKKNPDAIRVRVVQLESEIAAASRQDAKEAKETNESRDTMYTIKRFKSQTASVLAAMNALPPEKSDFIASLAFTPLVLISQDDGAKKADEMLDRVEKANSTNAVFLLAWAQMEMSRNQLDKSITLAQRVVALPDRPMSLDGLMLYQFRTRALHMQGDAWFARTQLEQDQTKRNEAIQKLKDLRKELAAKVGESDNSVLAIDGRLDFLAGDFLGARTRVSRYNEQTQQGDADMVMLEAALLNQLGQKGAAKSKYERVLVLQRNNVRALTALGMIEAGERDYKAAADRFTLASMLYPADPRLKELANNTKMLRDNVKTDDVLNSLVEAEKVGLGVRGDIQQSIKIVRDALTRNPADLRLTVALVQYLVAAKDIDGAKALLQDAIKKHPDNPSLKLALERLQRDPLELLLQQIDESKGTDLQKQLWRFAAYLQSGKPDEARKHLAEAAKIDPNDIGVINGQFDDALIRKDEPEQDRIVAKTRQLNLDKVGGDLFQARALMTRGKTQEAIGILKDITGRDKLNLMAWRLLGLALFDQGRFVEAADALKTAVGIKPDDIVAINACLHAMISAGQEGDALEMARKSEWVAVNDTNFFETYLTLEASAPGGDKAKAIDARDKLAKRRPENRANKTRLCTLLINSGRTEEADKLIVDLLKEDPNDPTAVQLQAACLGRKGKVGEAVETLKQYIASRKPEDRTAELYINTGRLMLQLGEPEQAVKILTDNRAAQNPKKPDEKPSAVIDRELGDLLYNLSSAAKSEAEHKERLDKALKSYQDVLDSGSEDKDHTVRKRMIEVCLKARDFDRMDKTIAQLPTVVQNEPMLLLLQAEAAAAQNQADKALRLYDQAVAADPKNPTAYLKRGDFKTLDPKTLRDALADYEQMKRVDPNSVVARVRMARVMRMLGRDDDAVKTVKDAISIEPFNEQLRLAAALMLREIGKNTEAAQEMEEAVKQFEGAKQWRSGAAQYWARVGRWDKAVEHMKEVWKDDKSIPAAIAFTEYLLNFGDTANAYNVLQSPTVASSVNTVLPLRMLRARVYSKTGRTADAAQEISDSLSLVRPESLEETSLFVSGIAGIYPEVEAQIGVLDRLEKSKPFGGYLALKAAEARMRGKGTREAALSALLALTADPKVTDKDAGDRIRARAWSLLGTDSYSRNNWAEAHERFAKGQALDPNNAELNNNLAYILATKLNRCEEALPFAEAACRMFTGKSDFLDTLGAAQLCAKKCDDAVKTLNAGLQAALNDADRVPLYIHMGKARLCQGDKIEARRLATVARDLLGKLPDSRQQYQADWDELDRSIHAN